MAEITQVEQIAKRAGFYVGHCRTCGQGYADFKPVPESYQCGYCQAEQEKAARAIEPVEEFMPISEAHR